MLNDMLSDMLEDFVSRALSSYVEEVLTTDDIQRELQKYIESPSFEDNIKEVINQLDLKELIEQKLSDVIVSALNENMNLEDMADQKVSETIEEVISEKYITDAVDEEIDNFIERRSYFKDIITEKTIEYLDSITFKEQQSELINSIIAEEKKFPIKWVLEDINGTQVFTSNKYEAIDAFLNREYVSLKKAYQ